MINSYVSIDLETTGLNPKKDKIIEIGAVKVKEGKIQEEFCTFINPGIKLPERITELTGIREKDIENAPFIDKKIEALLSFTENLPLLGHSVLFDFSFVKKAAVNQKKSFEKKGIDTLLISRKYLSELESRNLGFLCQYFKIPHQEHRALEDAKATHFLYQELCRKFYEENAVFALKDLIYQIKKESPITKHQKERLYELIEKHKLIVDYQVEHLTRNEASRYTDKILSEYGR